MVVRGWWNNDQIHEDMFIWGCIIEIKEFGILCRPLSCDAWIVDLSPHNTMGKMVGLWWPKIHWWPKWQIPDHWDQNLPWNLWDSTSNFVGCVWRILPTASRFFSVIRCGDPLNLYPGIILAGTLLTFPTVIKVHAMDISVPEVQ